MLSLILTQPSHTSLLQSSLTKLTHFQIFVSLSEFQVTRELMSQVNLLLHFPPYSQDDMCLEH